MTDEWIPSNPYEVEDQPETGASIMDVAKSGAAGALDAAAQAASSAQYGASQLDSPHAAGFFRGASDLLHTGSEALHESMTEGGQRAARAKWFPEGDEPSVSEAPVSSFAMKGASLAPYLFVLSAFPQSTIGSALAGGGLQTAQHIDAALSQTNKLSDDELKQQSPVYATMRESMDESDARSQLAKIQVQGKDILAAGIIGAIGNGAAAKALQGANTVGAGAVKGALTGAAEGALGMGSGAAEATYGAQQSQVNIGAQSDVNMHHVVMSGLEAMIDGGLIGGGFGAMHGMSERPAPTAKPAKPNIETTPELGADSAQSAALADRLHDAPQTDAPAPPAPEPTPAPEAPPAPEAAPLPPQVNDVGQNIPEAPATLQAQETALAQGAKKAVLYPKGTETPAAPDGMKAVKIKEGVVHYDPTQIKPKAIIEASKNKRLNDILDLGPANKDEVAARVDAGEQPVAVVERTPEGVEAKSAVGTEGTAPDQIAALEQTKLAPENTVAVEPPEQVLQDRMAAREEAPHAETVESPIPDIPASASAVDTGAPAPLESAPEGAPRKPRILEDVTPEGKRLAAEAAKASILKTRQNLKELEKEESGPKGKKWTKAELAAREENAAKSKALFDKHAQDELYHVSDNAGLQAYQDRLQKIVDGAAADGIKVPSKVGYEGTPDHIIWLADAQRVLNKLKQRRGTLAERMQEANTLMMREVAARDGDFEVMRSERKAEGERVKRVDQGDVEGKAEASTVVNPREVEDRMAETLDEPAEANTPIVRERAPAISAEEASKAVAGYKDKSGTFKVEAPKRRAVTLKSKDLEKARFHLRPKDGVVLHTPSGEEVSPIESRTLDDALGSVDYREHGKTLAGNRVTGLFAPLIAKRVRELAGDVPVHIVSNEDMKRLTSDEVGNYEVPGFYHPGRKMIILNSDHISSPAAYRHVVLHEGIHAALNDALELNSTFQRHVRDLMGEYLNSKPPRMRIAEEDARTQPVKEHYAYWDEHEFLSEALSNPVLARRLAEFDISDKLARQLGLADMRERSGWYGRIASGWDALVASARKALNLPERSHSALEAAMSIAERLTQEHPNFDRSTQEAVAARFMRKPKEETEERYIRPAALLQDALGAAARKLPTSGTVAEKTYKILSNIQLADWKKHLFGPDDGNPVMALVEHLERMGVKSRHYREEADPLIRDLHLASRKDPEAWADFVNLANDATMWGVHPDRPLEENAHLGLSKAAAKKLAKGKDVEHEGAMSVWQARRKYAELAKRYEALPDNYKALWHKSSVLFSSLQRENALANAKAVLDAFDLPSKVDKAALAERIVSKALTEEDSKMLDANKPLKDALSGARELQAEKGPYFPLMRRGDYVVTGSLKVPEPDNAKKLDDRTWEFATRKEAHAFAVRLAEDGLRTYEKIQHYDASGEPSIAEDAERSTYVVKVDRQYTAFHDSERQAQAHLRELEESGAFESLNAVDKKRLNEFVNSGLLSPQLKTLIGRLQKRTDISDAQKGILEKSLIESSISMMPGTRVQHRLLPRRNVAGASTDFLRNVDEYTRASAQFRARAEMQPTIDAALERMKKITEDNRHHEDTIDRRRVVQEFENRIYSDQAPLWSPAQKFMTLTFLRDMASPAHMIIHATHTTMISGPLLAARHGIAKSYAELARAYRDMGALEGVKAGVSGMVRSAKDIAAEPTRFLDIYKDALRRNAKDHKALIRMLDELTEVGYIHPDAGFVTERLHDYSGRAASALTHVESAFRELSSAAETINRVSEAVAAYRLELAKTGSHEKAVEYAKRTLSLSQNVYSATNTAPLFKGPLRPFLMFRQFAGNMYNLLARNLYLTFKGDTKEVRQEALRSFAGVVATHAAMAGALGLPLEPAKAVVMLGHMFGVAPSWSDVEADAQKKAVEMFGPEMGEVLMRGLSRWIGIDVRHRLGLGDLLLFGEPESAKWDDVMAWAAKTVSGAPIDYLGHVLTGVQHLGKGDFEKAFEEMVPIKGLEDIAKAYRLGTEGRPASQGKGMPPLSGYEAGMQALGFTPSRSANYGEARKVAHDRLQEQREQRRELINSWVKAETPADRAKAMARISAWNGQHKDDAARIMHKELMRAEDRIRSSNSEGASLLGMPMTPKNRRILEETSKTFNVR